MNWANILKVEKTNLSKLKEVYDAAPEIWRKAKKINPNWYNLINSYILELIKMHSEKEVDFFVKYARDWLDEMTKENKMLKSEKSVTKLQLPGRNNSKWRKLLTDISFDLQLQLFEKTFDKYAFAGFMQPTITYKKFFEWNENSAAKDLIPFSERKTDRAEFKENRNLVKENYVKLQPLMEKFKEHDSTHGGRSSPPQTQKLAHAQLVDLLKDAAETLKANQTPDWDEIETLMAKNYKSLQPKRRDKVLLISSLGDETVQTLIQYVPEDTPKLKAFFGHLKQDVEIKKYQVNDITPREALTYLRKFATKKKIRGNPIRGYLKVGLGLNKFLKGKQEKNQRMWLNPLLEGIMKQNTEVENTLANEWFSELSSIVIREDAVKEDYVNQSWNKYNTGNKDDDGILTILGRDNLDEKQYKTILNAQLNSPDKNIYNESRDKYVQSMKDKISRIRNSVTKDFVDFIDLLASALQEANPQGDNKKLVDAFLRAYSPEERSDFISKKQGRQNSGFGVVGGEKSPTQTKEGGAKQVVGLYKLPEGSDKYSEIVRELHNYLYLDNPPSNWRALRSRFRTFRRNPDNRHLTKEFHLQGLVGNIEEGTFKDANKLKSGSPLEKTIAYTLFDVYYTSSDLTGPNGIITSSPEEKLKLSNSNFISVIDFLGKVEKEVADQKVLRPLLHTLNDKYQEKIPEKERLRNILDGELDSDVDDFSKTLQTALENIRDGIKGLVKKRLEKIKNNQMDAINSTYPELLDDLVKEGFLTEE